MQKVYVLDSSVLLHDPQALYQFEDNEVVIPYAVLEELENKKGQPDNIGGAVREVIQTLDKLRIHGQLAQGIRLKSGGNLRIELNHSLPVGLPPASNLFLISNRILSLSLNLAREEERPVILVTKDIAMRVKADALGLATKDYYNDKVFLPPVGDDIVSIALTDEEVNLLCQGSPVRLRQAMQPNLCVKGVLSDNTNLPLVSSTTGSELIAAFGHKQLTWDIAPKNFEQNWAIAMLNNPNINLINLKTIITRAGEGTKIVLCGDPDQIDHPYLDKESNGMTYLTSRLKGQAFYGQIPLVCGERSKMATLAADLL